MYNTIMTSSLEVRFHDQSVRVVIMDGYYWFVVKDVAAALGVKHYHQELQYVPGVQRQKHYHRSYCKEKKSLWLIRYSGLYRLACAATPEKASAFMNWLSVEAFPGCFDGRVREDFTCYLENVLTCCRRIHERCEWLMSVADMQPLSTAFIYRVGNAIEELSKKGIYGTLARMRGSAFILNEMPIKKRQDAEAFSTMRLE